MKFVDVLKWIGVLPVAVIAWLVAYWVFNLMYNIFSPVEVSKWAITLMSSGGSGTAFVLAGSMLAPKGKKVVSIVLATIMVIFALVSLYLAFRGYGNDSVISIIACVATIVGSIYASISIHKE